jgi:SAM-dependent methyltransferase
MDAMEAILDFGCGCGRVARWWRDLDGPRIVGCDYDGRLVEWCESSLPFMEAKTNASLPPLPFRDASFDLVYAISLLTHLPEDRQGPWLRDVRRLLKPGGMFLFTVHGERWTPQLTEEERRRFEADELVVRSPELSGMEACAAFHPPRYVSERLLPAAGLELVDWVSEDRSGAAAFTPMVLQDSYLARRPTAGS